LQDLKFFGVVLKHPQIRAVICNMDLVLCSMDVRLCCGKIVN